LKNTLETAVVLSKNGLITSGSLRPLLSDFEELPNNRNLPVYLNKSPETLDRDMILRALFEIKKDILELKDLAFKNMEEANKHTNSNHFEINEIIPIEELEKKAIENALVYTKFNKKEAAELLKISERTLYRKLKEYEIN
jgi:DNA-binding NtrC family response regulator